MFDVGFWELSIIAVVALLVIGPERLPGVVRTAGLWFGKIRGFVTSVKEDIDKELRTDELKKILAEQEKSIGIHDIVEETEETIKRLQQQSDYLVKSPDEELQREMELLADPSISSAEEADPIRAAAAASPARAFDHHKPKPAPEVKPETQPESKPEPATETAQDHPTLKQDYGGTTKE